MERTQKDVLNTLKRLHRIVEAGERGYIVAASAVKNRALKLLFKSYAQDRARYKEEIRAEMQRLGALTRPRGSLLAAIHRGRIMIFAAMTIGEANIERVVLKEVNLGERIALRAYEKALSLNLPSDNRTLVQRQHDGIRQVVEKVQMLRGKGGKRLVVRLYDSQKDAEQAIRKLKESGYSADKITTLPLQRVEPYRGPGTSLIETILSGAVGGSFWGIVSGILATVGFFLAPRLGLTMPSPPALWGIILLFFLGLIAGGIFVGSGLGFFIGLGIRNEDAYLYDDGLEHGQRLLEVLTDASRAAQARQLLTQVNIESRA